MALTAAPGPVSTFRRHNKARENSRSFARIPRRVSNLPTETDNKLFYLAGAPAKTEHPQNVDTEKK